MERLQKVIANAGITSRRKAEELILNGAVKVNGKVIKELGTKVSSNDKVEVNEVPIYKEEPVYFLFYKPKGVISAVSDDKKRPVVTDFFQGVPERIYPVGRLDYDTSGLLLLTNDGEFAQALTHPSFEVEKKYVAKVKGLPTPQVLKPLEKGIKIDNYKTAPAKVKILSTDLKRGNAIVELIIHEGRNHQVKKMLENVGFPVSKLKREGYGQLGLGNLNPGEFRELSKKEVSTLLNIAKNIK